VTAADASEARVVLVTGAGARVGRAIALACAARGLAVAVHFRSSAAGAAEVVASIEARGGRASAFGADLSDPAACAALPSAVAGRMGRLDALVNSASTFAETPLGSLTAAAWDAVMAVNLRAPHLLAEAALPWLRAAGPGRIVNIGDAQARHPRRDWIAHAVSKGGLSTLTRALARALAPEVLVNQVTPGPVLMAEGAPEADVARAIARVPLGRVGAPEDVALAVVFLLTDAGYSTGAEIPVDGGRGLG